MQKMLAIIGPRYRNNEFKIILFSSIICIFILSNYSLSAQWPYCSFQCRAGDVVVREVWLGDFKGNSLSPCNPESDSITYVWARFENNANAPRYAVILLGEIYVNEVLQRSFYDQGLCVLDSIPSKAIKSAPLCSLTWKCGQKVEIKRLVLSWETAHGASCEDAGRKCSNRNTKCFGGPEFEMAVSLPLAADFYSDDKKCCCDGISLQAGVSGGAGPYTYLWDFGDGSDSISLENPLHLYDRPGRYEVTLKVGDSKGSYAAITKEISVFPRPSAQAGPDLSIRPGGSVRLEGSAIGGTLPYSYSWSPKGGLDDPFSSRPLASPEKTTIYSLWVEDAYSCSGSNSTTVYISAVNITKTILKNPVERGKEAVYKYIVENSGDSDLRNITVVDSVFGIIFGPLEGDLNADGVLNAGEAWIYQAVFRPLANATSSARASAVDPAGATIFVESAKVAVNVTMPEEPLQCQILGLNIVCEDVIAFYSPAIKGEDLSDFNFSWKIDGSEIGEASDDSKIQVAWSRYGGGYHILQLRASRVCEDEKECNGRNEDKTGICDMKVLVVEVPSAVIEMDSN